MPLLVLNTFEIDCCGSLFYANNYQMLACKKMSGFFNILNSYSKAAEI